MSKRASERASERQLHPSKTVLSASPSLLLRLREMEKSRRQVVQANVTIRLLPVGVLACRAVERENNVLATGSILEESPVEYAALCGSCTELD